MKWVGIVLGALVAVVAVAAVIGAMLPRAHRVSRRARFRQTPEALYAVLAGPPDWRSDVKEFGSLPARDGRQQWWETSRGQRITYELLEDSPPVRRVTRIADKNLPFGGTWTLEIAREADGAVLRITEDGEVHNVIFRFMARFVFGYTGSIDGFLRDLGRKFGQVQIEG
ncbi:MAG TPA: hypothetical protein VMH28_08435 [Candidatus Acidoferrales bacterium]|nr:hypothetical protein [Candidatus Acidoferrales bacterium]